MLAVVVLAAGKGTRMESDLPKVLHPLWGIPLLAHVLKTAKALRPDRLIVVVGHGREIVRQQMAEEPVLWAVQDPQLGTGHAVQQAMPALEGFAGDVVVLSGDVPLLNSATLAQMMAEHRSKQAAVTVLSTTAPDPFGYGRIIRDEDGGFVRIVEHREATEPELRIMEVNSGVYCFTYKYLAESLADLKADNTKGEYYLTDVIAILWGRGLQVQAVNFAAFSEVRGINSIAELKAAEQAVKSTFPSD